MSASKMLAGRRKRLPHLPDYRVCGASVLLLASTLDDRRQEEPAKVLQYPERAAAALVPGVEG